jgi:hypothetical protein
LRNKSVIVAKDRTTLRRHKRVVAISLLLFKIVGRSRKSKVLES